MRRIALTLLMAMCVGACDEKTSPEKIVTTKPVAGEVKPAVESAAVAESKPSVAEKPPVKSPPETPTEPVRADLSEALTKFAPGWMAKDCGAGPSGPGSLPPGIHDELGKKNVLVTYPLSATQYCVMGRRVDVLPDKKTTLHLVVGHAPDGEWVLSVTADHELVHKVIGKETAPDGWTNVDVDLSSYAGQIITVQLINASHGKPNAAGHWAKIEME